MRPFSRLICLGIASAFILIPAVRAQDPPVTSGQASKDQSSDKTVQTDKNKKAAAQAQNGRITKAQQKKLYNELGSPYKVWLDNDVPYIITDAERETFLKLSTNEERENFIENFWLRRDPTPDTPENEFKEEHFRRIAYANEHFASGEPGWKTDRGRIYIIWGKPDDIDAHPTGGQYNRTPEEGGGSTSTYPFEIWTYNYLEGLGNNIKLEFLDKSGTNQYYLTTDPGEKDALLYVPGAGLSEMEEYGMADKTQRFTQSNGTTNPISEFSYNTGDQDEFTRLELAAKIFVAPPVKFKGLEELVTSRIVRNQLPFDYGFSYLKITSDTVMVPITIELNNRSMSYEEKDGVHLGTLNLYARISTIGGRIVQIFEDTIHDDFPDTLFQQYLTKKSIYGKTIPLSPGLYRLDIVLKDTKSGNTGVVSTSLKVPRFDSEKLDASSLILADSIEKVPPRQIGIGPFVLGDVKVRPALNQEFLAEQKMGIYFQVYNLKLDPTTHKSNAVAHVKITNAKGDQSIIDTSETSEDFKQFGDQLTIETQITLHQSDFAPGKYKLEITIDDKVGNQSLTRSQEFTVKPIAPAARATASN
jgi:GWxTD domain-containing protein